MYLSVDEINKDFDGEWIYAIDCQEDDLGNVLGGKVVLHSPNRDNVIRGMGKYEKEVDTLTYFRYAGKIPAEVSILL